MDRKDVVIGVGSGNAIQINLHPSASPTLSGHASAGVIDKDTAHRLGGRGEEVIPPVELLVPDQPQVGLVHESGGVEGVPRGFSGHFRGAELPQFVIDEREQIRGGLAVSLVSGFDQTGHI